MIFYLEEDKALESVATTRMMALEMKNHNLVSLKMVEREMKHRDTDEDEEDRCHDRVLVFLVRFLSRVGFDGFL